MPRTDFLSKQRKQISTRLEELRPLYEEYLTLEKAQQALEQVGDPIGRAAGRRPGRPRSRRAPGRPATRRGRPAGQRSARGRSGSTRADQTVKVIEDNPGITIPELADKLGMRPNYLYRVTAGLQKERRIRRAGRGFYPA